jgi:hypothetical protein
MRLYLTLNLLFAFWSFLFLALSAMFQLYRGYVNVYYILKFKFFSTIHHEIFDTMCILQTLHNLAN